MSHNNVNWQIKKLGECNNITSGGTPSRNNPEYFDGNINWVKMGDLKSDYIYETEEKITKKGLENSSAKMLPKDTVIVAMYTHDMGKTAILGTESATNQAICALQCNDELIPKFLYYFIRSKNEYIKKLGSGGAQPNINLTKIKELEISFPTKDLQQKIIQKLDYVFAQLEEKKQTISELQKKKIFEIEKLLKNSWNHVFEYLINDAERVNISLGELLTDIKLGSNSKAFSDKNGIPVLRMPNIQNGHIDYSSLKYTKFSSQDEKKYLLKKDDILINRTNSPELVGKSAVFDEDRKFAFASYLIRIRVDETRVDPHFLVTYMNSNLGRKYIESVYVKTAGQANINSQHLKSMPILLPNLNKQKMIMKNITPLLYSELSELHVLLKQSLESQDGLKQKFNNLSASILYTAFSGKLVN